MKVKLRVKFQRTVVTKCNGMVQEGEEFPLAGKRKQCLVSPCFWGPWTLSSIPSCRCPWGLGMPHAPGPLNEGGPCFPRTFRKAHPPGLIPAVTGGRWAAGKCGASRDSRQSQGPSALHSLLPARRSRSAAPQQLCTAHLHGSLENANFS